jgi:hypothetical protein
MRRVGLLAGAILLVSIVPMYATGQGRGRGIGLGRKSDVFVNSHDARGGRWDLRGPTLDRKCGKFVNCHDARDGRWDGRGPRMTFARNRIFVGRGLRVRQRSNRSFERAEFRRSQRLDWLEMQRRERIAERRHLGRAVWRRP